MEELLPIIAIAVIWFFVRGLSKANKTRPGQPGQKAVQEPLARSALDDTQPISARDEWTRDYETRPTEEGAPRGEWQENMWREGHWSVDGHWTTEEHWSEDGSKPVILEGESAWQGDTYHQEGEAAWRKAKAAKTTKTHDPAANIHDMKRANRRTLTAEKMRSAVILAEIIAPPKSRRRKAG